MDLDEDPDWQKVLCSLATPDGNQIKDSDATTSLTVQLSEFELCYLTHDFFLCKSKTILVSCDIVSLLIQAILIAVDV